MFSKRRKSFCYKKQKNLSYISLTYGWNLVLLVKEHIGWSVLVRKEIVCEGYGHLWGIFEIYRVVDFIKNR